MRAWEDFLGLQEKELGGSVVNQWLRPLKVLRFDACNLYLEAGDSFKAVWFEEHMRHKVQMHLFNNNGKPIKVHLSVASQKQKENANKKASAPTSTFKLTFDTVSADFSFPHFITSQGNLLAYKLLCEACGYQPKSENLPLSFNPIYLFGRSGTGKTHLLSATANFLKEQGYHAIYVRADTFTEHVVNAIRSGEMQTFRKAYRHADALLIDDIEILSRKGATQEELFHTFNTLHTEGKQIIVSSHCSPQELKYIEPRLVSRFEWGIVVPMQGISKEEMQQVLLQKARRVQFPLHEGVVEFLLETFNHSTKNLVRALEALVLRTHLNQGLGTTQQLPLPLNSVKHILADLILEEEKAILTPEKIVKSVAEHYGIRTDDILSKSQSRECVLPRQIAMHLCRHHLHLPYIKIGDLFSRDHSTVMASVRLVEKGLEEKNLEILGSINSILKKLELR